MRLKANFVRKTLTLKRSVAPLSKEQPLPPLSSLKAAPSPRRPSSARPFLSHCRRHLVIVSSLWIAAVVNSCLNPQSLWDFLKGFTRGISANCRLLGKHLYTSFVQVLYLDNTKENVFFSYYSRSQTQTLLFVFSAKVVEGTSIPNRNSFGLCVCESRGESRTSSPCQLTYEGQVNHRQQPKVYFLIPYNIIYMINPLYLF